MFKLVRKCLNASGGPIKFLGSISESDESKSARLQEQLGNLLLYQTLTNPSGSVNLGANVSYPFKNGSAYVDYSNDLNNGHSITLGGNYNSKIGNFEISNSRYFSPNSKSSSYNISYFNPNSNISTLIGYTRNGGNSFTGSIQKNFKNNAYIKGDFDSNPGKDSPYFNLTFGKTF